MLAELHIKNFAIIDALTIELNSGMTVLTGETGAGKSILIDAIGLVLGDRADKDMIRHGAERTVVSARLVLDDHPRAIAWLAEHDFGSDAECVLRRIVQNDGRSRAYINDTPTTMARLRELGQQLIDIHGQHAHQSLLEPRMPRVILDQFGQCEELTKQVHTAYLELSQLQTQFDLLSQSEQQRAQRVDYLQFQIDELDGLELNPKEIADKQTQSERLAKADGVAAAISQALDVLVEQDTDTVEEQLYKVRKQLITAAPNDTALQQSVDLLQQTEIHLAEAIDTLRHASDHFVHDPERLNLIEDELGQLQTIARKHGVELASLASTFAELNEELAELLNADESLAELEEQIDQAQRIYFDLAKQLSNQRLLAAKRLSKQVSATLKEVALASGAFEVGLRSDPDQVSAHGQDTIEFLVQTNPGQPFRPLGKVASGGELSRIGLAIQVIISGLKLVPVMIFDEVDAGIGGGIAEQVGKRLRELANSAQVMCVTHLPQVASLAHHHLLISKTPEDNDISVSITPLKQEQKVDELARMLGGVTLTDATRAHAEEMIQQAKTS